MAFMAKKRAQAHYNAGSMIFLNKSPSPKALRKAIEHLQKATKLDPSFAFAFHNLAHAWYMVSEGTIAAARRSDLQIEAYNEKERCKDHSDVEDFITSVLECALNAVDQALTINYEFPQAHNTRAMILAKLGRLDEAIEATEVALSQDPDYKNASENREKIKELRRNALKF